ncbi:MAG TPA: TldD/PmbA family protein [Acidimicrobiales bacterium]|nr:TldD/PmbA family protein [Acidimicrobiales bacterium]
MTETGTAPSGIGAVGGGLHELEALASAVAAQARAGEALEVYVSRGVETDIRAYEGEVESLSSAASAGIGIRVLVDGRQGFAYAGSLDEEVVRDTLAEARDNVAFATPDPHVGLATPDGVPRPAIDVWDDAVLTTSTADKVALALELERRARQIDPRVRTVSSADYGDIAAEAAIATSNGIVSSSRRTVCSLAADAIAGEGADSQSGVGFSAGRGPGSLELERAAADAVERAVRMLGATKARSGRVTVVFDPRVSSSLLAIVSSALSGESVTKGRSMFAGRIGEEVAAGQVTVVDDPTDVRAFGAAASDAEGLACRRNVLIENGVLRGFVFDSTAARRFGTTSTASAVRGGYASGPIAGCRALLLSPGALSGEEILAAVGDGLYVQSISGVHSGVNPVSGDFSVGAEGLVIRGGALAEPVREVTIASTLQRMLQSLVHIGGDVEWLPGVAAGQTLAIEGMSLSGS